MPHGQSDFPGSEEHPRLAAELRALANRHPAPDELDRRVLGAVHVARGPVPWSRGLAVAAVIVVAIGVISLLLVPSVVTRQYAAPRVAWDVTADGQLDVLDAFALAKAIERGDADGFADFNSDGQIDAADLSVLTARIVRVDTGKDSDS